ncbi:uncharacterized protein KQ657_001905 [Scheffersomyces spartinae]|uniref:RING-type domain-containing protein n=1 Tax=Scheffersomyces spartinae TaxID=45513 RepID=A0A9P8AGW6_9ASCO|nr:uncharacterized protein KQ657_001905 [Scheffersomyces spartinae]KAG7192191.1 hypothetical protein KQ657_001905 [Scheffersomyces spartinae]
MVADVQWSPHHNAKPSWCISTLNQKALLWDLARPSHNAISQVLHHHSRAITDINFHPYDPEVLATCSIDTFILRWDMRTPRRPVAKWAEWRAGTTQVKWNHENSHQLASSHDSYFYIWDDRYGSAPLFKVNMAHEGKINGIDFSSGLSNFITCSNDSTVKFWNLKDAATMTDLKATDTSSSSLVDEIGFFDGLNKKDRLQPSVVIHTDYPVARARSLPFGQDLTCGIMPLRDGDDSIHLFNYEAAYRRATESGQPQHINCDPDYSFKGHNGPIKDFLWRTRREKYDGFTSPSSNHHQDFQLVSWSSLDYDLMLWPYDEELYDIANYNPSHQDFFGSIASQPDLNLNSDLEVSLDEEKKVVKTFALPDKVGCKLNKGDEGQIYKYKTFSTEPVVEIDDLVKKNDGDMLSSLVQYQISEMESSIHLKQINHLDWISGVRMGRAGHGHNNNNNNNNSSDNNKLQYEKKSLTGSNGTTKINVANDIESSTDVPNNLGEEVSIVAHKFPKVKFEQISISTGELVMSLRGPLPKIELEQQDERPAESQNAATGNTTTATTNKRPRQSTNQTSSTSLTQLQHTTSSTSSSGTKANVTTATTTSTLTITHSLTSPTSTIPANSTTTIISGSRPSEKLAGQSTLSPLNNSTSHNLNSITMELENEGSMILETDEKDVTETLTIIEDEDHVQELVFIRISIHFPKDYPYLQDFSNFRTVSGLKRIARLKKQNLIRFDIEETHELDDQATNTMKENLFKISEFYTNKYNRFCLEPCLRYLMGDKIELSEDLMLSVDSEEGEKDGVIDATKNVWSTDLVDTREIDLNEHRPGMVEMDNSGDEEDEEELGDLLANANAEDMVGSIDSLEEEEEQNTAIEGLKSNNNSLEVPNAADNAPLIDSTPIPKGCGAVWTPTGQLVCFFIPKSDPLDLNKELLKFNIFRFTEGGFSVAHHQHHHHHNHLHLHHRSHLQKDASVNSTFVFSESNRTIDGYDDEGEDADNGNELDLGSSSDALSICSTLSDDSNSSQRSSSSSESFTSDLDELLQDQIRTRSRVPGLFKSMGLGGRYIDNGTALDKFTSRVSYSNHRSSEYGGSGKGGDYRKGIKRGALKKNLNIVGIFDFRHLLPDKYELASEYRVLGDTPENLARYNSAVAEKYGLQEIKDVWRLLEMILIKDIKLIEQSEKAQDIFPSNRDWLNDSVKTFRFYWGSHPLGHNWLIKEIFNYFEQRKNLQMLAMLSCILYERLDGVLNSESSANSHFNIPIHTPYSALPPVPLKNRGYGSLSTIVLDSISVKEQMGTPHRNLTSLQNEYGPQRNRSFGSYNNDYLGESNTPERFNVGGSKKFLKHVNTTTSLGDYIGEWKRFSSERRSFASLDYNISLNSSATTSRDNNNSRNRLYPHSTFAKRSQQQQYKKNLERAPTVNIELVNANELDLFENVFSSGLLSSQDANKIKSYREQYADMLYLWGLPINRLKILKFNYSDLNLVSSSLPEFQVHKCLIGLREKYNNTVNPSYQGNLSVSTVNGWQHHNRQKLKNCNYCNLLVTRSLVVCTNCEHVMHSACALEWWSQVEETQDCPSGCGCNCLNYRI